MKKTIITLIIGIILGLSINAIAGSYNAKQISFTPSDNSWNVKNVSGALDNIKQTDKTEIANLQSAISNKNAIIDELNNRKLKIGNTISLLKNYGTNQEENNTLQLSKGKYICSVNATVAWNSNVSNSYTVQNKDLITINNCDNYQELYSNNFRKQTATNEFSTGIYLTTYLASKDFVCEVNSTKNISIGLGGSTNNQEPRLTEIHCNSISVE